MPKPKFYVVWKGRKTGIFPNWEQASAQVNAYAGAEYKAFDTRQEAEQAYRGAYADYVSPRPHQGAESGAGYETKSGRDKRVRVPGPILTSYCVDAACSGNPGPLEYRCVQTKSGEEVFREGPLQNGTSNIGEFLAIVHMLMDCQKRRIDWPIYSDSRVALGWVKGKKCKTTLARTRWNARLFMLIDEAEAWLETNTCTNPLLKWETEEWGENPADFGRK